MIHEKMKQIIRLTETELHNIIKESVNNVLRESGHEGWKEEDWNPNYPKDDDDEPFEDELEWEDKYYRRKYGDK